jgi:hypothetical protein
MTLEEEKEFRQKVIETILPLAMNMTEDQIRNIISAVEKDNPSLPEGFGGMLFQQIIVYKYNQLNR